MAQIQLQAKIKASRLVASSISNYGIRLRCVYLRWVRRFLTPDPLSCDAVSLATRAPASSLQLHGSRHPRPPPSRGVIGRVMPCGAPCGARHTTHTNDETRRTTSATARPAGRVAGSRRLACSVSRVLRLSRAPPAALHSAGGRHSHRSVERSRPQPSRSARGRCPTAHDRAQGGARQVGAAGLLGVRLWPLFSPSRPSPFSPSRDLSLLTFP